MKKLLLICLSVLLMSCASYLYISELTAFDVPHMPKNRIFTKTMEWIYVYREPFNLEIKYSNIEEGKLIYEGVELIPQGIEPKFNFHYKAIMSFKDSSYGVVYYYSAKPDFIEICKVRRDETMKNLHEYLLSTKNEFFEWLKNEREP